MNHDGSYKALFSHPQMVRDLLEGFVDEDWVALLDFETLEPVEGSYISEEFLSRESDIVWRLKLKNDSTWLYLYLLLEFQSTVDPTMALRMLVYVGLLYQSLIKSGEETPIRLPPVLPIVLYNGDARWQAATDLSDLFVTVPPRLARYLPVFHYLLLDEGVYDDKQLPIGNLVAALFRLENSSSREQMAQVVLLLREWLANPAQESLRRDFATMLRMIIRHRLPEGADEPTITLQENRQMLLTRVEKWTEEWFQEGKQEGKQEGEQRGRQEGEQRAKLSIARSLLDVLDDLTIAAKTGLPLATIRQLRQE